MGSEMCIRDRLDLLAEALLEKETLDAAQVEEIFSGTGGPGSSGGGSGNNSSGSEESSDDPDSNEGTDLRVA